MKPKTKHERLTTLGLSLVSALAFSTGIQETKAESGFSMKAIDATAVATAGATFVPPFRPQNIPSSLENFNPEAFLICINPADLQGGGG